VFAMLLNLPLSIRVNCHTLISNNETFGHLAGYFFAGKPALSHHRMAPQPFIPYVSIS
jgi:hypothetical protein